MKPRYLQLLLHHLLLLMTWQISCGVLITQYPKTGDGKQYTNMAVHGESVYLAENGKLSRLHVADLSVNASTGTCASSEDCKNVNKILLVNDSLVITCGTGNGGRCESRSNQLEVKLESSADQEENRNVLVVSSNLKRPAVGLLLEGTEANMVFGVTQGPPLSTFGASRDVVGDGYRYFISLRSLDFNKLGYRTLYLMENQHYLIYFRHVFFYNGYVYFLTNQKKTLGDNDYVTKLISVCPKENVILNGGLLESYVDIMLTCTYNGTEFKLLQDADFIEVGGRGKLVGIFSRGTDPESPSADTAVCIFSMGDINKTISAAREDYIVKPGNAWANTSHYIKKPVETLDDWFIKKEYYQESDVSCGELPRPTVGNKVFTANASYHSDERESKISKIKGTVQYGSKMDVFAGTLDGQVLKLSWKDDKLHNYETLPSKDSGAVRAIHHGDDFYLVLTDKKLYKYRLSDCSEFTTCSDTMGGLNPRCGWCVYSGRSTTKDACPVTDTWLPSLTECLKLTAVPQGIHVPEENQNVTISVDNVDISYDESYPYKCVFRYSDVKFENSAASRSGNKFTCNIPKVEDHKLATLQLSWNGQVLAQTSFLFYSCDQFHSCGECVSTVGAQCTWCPGQYMCQKSEICTDTSLTTTKISQCPSLVKSEKIYIASGIETTVTFSIKFSNKTTGSYTCIVDAKTTLATATSTVGEFSCPVNVSIEFGKYKDFGLKIRYSRRSIALDDNFNTKVTVYRCAGLVKTCSECYSLLPRYKCMWSAGCVYGARINGTSCPPPVVTRIQPMTGPSKGNTDIMISGTEFGEDATQVKFPVMIGGLECSKKTVNTYVNPDFNHPIPKSIVCTTFECPSEKIGQPLAVTVEVNQKSSSNQNFTYWTPVLKAVSPTKGPVAGGTKITLTGDNLGIGNRATTEVDIQTTAVGSENLPCWSVEVVLNDNSQQYQITCKTNNVSSTMKADVLLKMDSKEYNKVNFSYVSNPIIEDLVPKNGFLSGGTLLTIAGKDLKNAGRAEVSTVYMDQKSTVSCEFESDSKAVCGVPPAPDGLKDVMSNSATRRRRAASNSTGVTAKIVVAFDGVEKIFDINYFVDPSISPFDKDTREIESGGHTLMIKGSNLDLVARMEDYSVKVGRESCTMMNLTRTFLVCITPKQQPKPGIPTNSLPEVNVSVGNINKFVGYVHYKEIVNELTKVWTIIGAVAGGFVVLLIIGIVFGVCKYRRVGQRAEAFKEKLSNIELEVKRVAREEFLDMHTMMTSMNRNLVEQGFPFHGYQTYAFNVMFPTDCVENHCLLREPVLQDSDRLKVQKNMTSFENLLLNKFFLKSVILTMEKQKKFSLKDRSNFAGNLSTILLGKMDYMKEILNILLTNLVHESAGKRTQKTLFRRCESITEKLLSNWLSLCLYPHIKENSGSQLYLLMKATQITMESGPVDAITGDAKYTLSDKKLLKKFTAAESMGSEPKFEAEALTLNVVVDNCDDTRKCKVLDCDTITQVKSKCLSQIYVNFPASQLVVDAKELDLEWHEGYSGRLNLRDEDTTSKVDGGWLRLNTLAHYNMKDGSNVSLIDPKSAGICQEEDYVNLAQISDVDASNISIGSNDPLTGAMHVEEMPDHIKRWHLVKQAEDDQNEEKSLIDELYYNRLFTTKQCILSYIHPLFDIILNHEFCPLPTKFLFDLLDDLAEKNKVEADIVHTWKSHSYAIRHWASLIKRPAMMFDVRTPGYVETSLEVISQAFIDSFSLTTQKYTKDSSPQKFIFLKEMDTYREKGAEFYRSVQAAPSEQDQLRQYLTKVNKLQKDTSFHKLSALDRLYGQLQDSMEDIIEDLSNNRDTVNLHLHKKLETIVANMEEEL